MQQKLKAFNDKRKNADKPLGYKLDGIERLIRSWGSTYWFTGIGDRSRYNNLHVELGKNVESLLASHGLVFKHPDRSLLKKMKALGVREFTVSVQQTRAKILADPAKKNMASLFYDEATLQKYAKKETTTKEPIKS